MISGFISSIFVSTIERLSIWFSYLLAFIKKADKQFEDSLISACPAPKPFFIMIELFISLKLNVFINDIPVGVQDSKLGFNLDPKRGIFSFCIISKLTGANEDTVPWETFIFPSENGIPEEYIAEPTNEEKVYQTFCGT